MSSADAPIANVVADIGRSMAVTVINEANKVGTVNTHHIKGFWPSIGPNDAKVQTSVLSLDEQLFDERAKLKIAVSRVSMHLKQAWRESIFRQIDVLYSSEDWEDDSTFATGDAFRTLLRFIVFAAPNSLPSLAIAPNGNPVASWADGDRRVHIEFLPSDLANALLAKSTDRGPEAVSWRGPITNIFEFVRAFGNSACLGW